MDTRDAEPMHISYKSDFKDNCRWPFFYKSPWPGTIGPEETLNQSNNPLSSQEGRDGPRQSSDVVRQVMSQGLWQEEPEA